MGHDFTSHALALGLAMIVAGCTNAGADCASTDALEVVRGCTDFCRANFDDGCEDVWYTQITSFDDRTRCADLCQWFQDLGEAADDPEVSCVEASNHYLLCLSNAEACGYSDQCAVEYASLRSCFRDWCNLHPERCSDDWPQLAP